MTTDYYAVTSPNV